MSAIFLNAYHKRGKLMRCYANYTADELYASIFKLHEPGDRVCYANFCFSYTKTKIARWEI